MTRPLSAGALAAGRRRLGPTGHGPVAPLAWQLRVLPVCASTERQLDAWLDRRLPGRDSPALQAPMAVLAEHQRFAQGQQGRTWLSPPGGVWLSAALPWPADPVQAAVPGLAAAVGVALQLEALGLPVRIKWPNDLLLERPGRPAAKLAGLLPRLRLRGGRIRWARVGLGLNGCNPVPPVGVNLVAALGRAGAAPRRLAPRVLAGLEWAMAAAGQPERVWRLADQRLWLPPQPLRIHGEDWQPLALARDGGLLLASGARRRVLQRSFEGI